MKRTFSNKEIILGVTGSIAAYKACELASRLTQLGATVRAVLTRSAQQLVQPATFEAVTGRPCIVEMFGDETNPDIDHITVAQRAHLFMIAPATANILAKAAHGIADDWLTTALLATRAPKLIAPAMNAEMYRNSVTQENIARLRVRGFRFVGPDSGRQACGTVGPGRLIDTETIVEAALPLVSTNRDLRDKHVVITSGATHEPIDPVRFIGNRSSGKMGRALALEALARGARVTVIAGPSEVGPPYGVMEIPVQTAREMSEVAMSLAQDADVFVGAAAVGDYAIDEPAEKKRKRGEGDVEIQLTENPDVLGLVAALKHNSLITVGFAAETNDHIKHAKAKLKRKKLDLIVANEVGVEDSGFGAETTRAAIIDRGGRVDEFPLQSKDDLAATLFDRIAKLV